MSANLTILTKGLILIVVPCLFQLAFIGLTSLMEWQNAEAQAWSSHTEEVLQQAQTMLTKLVDSETGTRGFILTDDPVFIEPFVWANQELPAVLDHLVALVGDNLPQKVRAQRIADKATQLHAWHAAEIQLMRSGARDEAMAQVKLLQGKKQLDDLRQEIQVFQEEENRLNVQRRQTLATAQRRLRWLSWGGTILSLITVLVLALTFSRGISGRLAILTENARRLGQGRELAQPIRGSDEIAQLDQAFHAMAQELTSLNAELEQRVADRTAELASANRELEHQNQENEMFVYSVSHDLRSPLVNLEGFSQELGLTAKELRALLDAPGLPAAVRERAQTLVDSDMAESIRFIHTAVRRLSNIIDALLRLSRVGRVEYRWQEVDPTPIVRRIVESMHATIRARGAAVQVQDLPVLWGDATAIEQVFANLIGNALNYLDPQRAGQIEIGSQAAANHATPAEFWTCYVQDNGLGIPEPYQAKIFQAFQRIHPEAAPGEGLGLTLVRRIVERHRGKIWVESRQGEGSRFYVALPGRDANGATPAGRAP